MQVTVVVGDVERQLGNDGVASASGWPFTPEYQDQTQGVPLADDEAELLDELTRLCRGILLEEGVVFSAD